MGDRTPFTCYIYACPDDERAAAAEVLAGIPIDYGMGDEPPPRYVVTDDTLNADGKPIKRGQDALTLGYFATREAAAAHVASLPGASDDRYSVDEVADITLTERYADSEMSCGSADEHADNLIAAAPGCSFVLWEDPKYEWLGSVEAYTPELGRFTAECDANGTPVLTPEAIKAMIDKAADLDALREAMARATGAAWFADWRDHDTEPAAAA